MHLLGVVAECAPLSYLPGPRRRVDQLAGRFDLAHVDRRELGMDDRIVSVIRSAHPGWDLPNQFAIKEPIMPGELIGAFGHVPERFRNRRSDQHEIAKAVECQSAFKRDPFWGVIGVEQGPPVALGLGRRDHQG